MRIEEIQNFLLTSPGYLKWGDVRLALKLDVDLEKIKIARANLRNIAGPNILFLDIETAPIKAYVWGLWQQNVYLDQIESDWFMLSWAAKWEHNDEMLGACVTPQESVQENDKKIVQKLWKVLEVADIVVTHNGDRFDLRKINARFIEHGLTPVSPYKSIDTLKVVRKQFSFSSNKLEALARKFGFEVKHSTDFNLWKDALKGDPDSLNYMFEYNKNDVKILENVYYKIKPWISNHPNVGLYILDGEEKCPVCGNSSLQKVSDYITAVQKYHAFRCSSCGAISRKRTTALSPEERNGVLTLAK